MELQNVELYRGRRIELRYGRSCSKIAEGYAVVLTADALAELNLVEGSAVEIRPVAEAEEVSRSQIRYADADEVAASFERTLPQHEGTYRELAK